MPRRRKALPLEGRDFGFAEIRSLPPAPHDQFGALHYERVVGYARVSDMASTRPGEITIPQQIKEIREWCAKERKEYVGIYWDVKTGPSLDRPGYQALIKAGHEDQYDTICFWLDDRLCRGLVGAHPINLLHQYKPNIKFHTLHGSFNIEWIGIHATMSELERQKTRERTMGMRLGRADLGQWVSAEGPYWIGRHVRYGEDKRPIKDDPYYGKPEVDGSRARYVYQAIQMYMADKTVSEIGTMLRLEAPDHPRYPNCDWSTVTILNLLKHPALHGVLPYARLKRNTTFNPTTAEESTATQRLKLDDQRVRLIPVEPLIHKDEIDLAACISRGGCNLDEYPTFEAIQAQMAARRSTLGRQITYTWPLRNLVYCEGCDNYMHVFSTGFDYGKLADGTRVKYTKKNPAIRLKCFNMNNRSRRLAQGWKPCRPTVAVSGGEVWATVRSAIIDKLRHPDLLEAALEERQREMEAARHEAVADLATVERVQAQIDDYTRKLARLYDDYQEGLLDKDAYLLNKAEWEARKHAAIEHRVDLLRTESRVSGSMQALAQAKHTVETLSRWLAETGGPRTDEEWEQVCPYIIERITITRDNAYRLSLKFGMGDAVLDKVTRVARSDSDPGNGTSADVLAQGAVTTPTGRRGR